MAYNEPMSGALEDHERGGGTGTLAPLVAVLLFTACARPPSTMPEPVADIVETPAVVAMHGHGPIELASAPRFRAAPASAPEELADAPCVIGDPDAGPEIDPILVRIATQLDDLRILVDSTQSGGPSAGGIFMIGGAEEV